MKFLRYMVLALCAMPALYAAKDDLVVINETGKIVSEAVRPEEIFNMRAQLAHNAAETARLAAESREVFAARAELVSRIQGFELYEKTEGSKITERLLALDVKVAEILRIQETLNRERLALQNTLFNNIKRFAGQHKKALAITTCAVAALTYIGVRFVNAYKEINALPGDDAPSFTATCKRTGSLIAGDARTVVNKLSFGFLCKKQS